MSRKTTSVSQRSLTAAKSSVARLDDLMHDLALLIVRRQMRGEWLRTLSA